MRKMLDLYPHQINADPQPCFFSLVVLLHRCNCNFYFYFLKTCFQDGCVRSCAQPAQSISSARSGGPKQGSQSLRQGETAAFCLIQPFLTSTFFPYY
jgi:hypothetical protein